MIRIERDTLYTRVDLAEMLKPAGVDVDTFIARLKARKVFRQCWLGEDILAAYRQAPALSDTLELAAAPVVTFAPATSGHRSGRRPKAAPVVPGSKLQAYRQTLKDDRS